MSFPHEVHQDAVPAGTEERPDASDAVPAAAGERPEALDAVRDILFGGQMRTVEARLRSMEERFQAEQDTLRTEFGRRTAEVEQFARRETEALQQRLSAETDARVRALRELADEVKDAFRQSNQRHVALEQSTSLSDAELRDQLIALATSSAAELDRIHGKLSDELQRSHAALSHAKTDRSSLAAMLGDVARRIADGPGSPQDTQG